MHATLQVLAEYPLVDKPRLVSPKLGLAPELNLDSMYKRHKDSLFELQGLLIKEESVHSPIDQLCL